MSERFTLAARFSFNEVGSLASVLAAVAARDEELIRNQPATPEGAVGYGLVCDREQAHRRGRAHSQLNGEQPIFALLGYEDIQSLEGRLLTIMDASFTDREQRKAVKDLVRNAVWFDWVPNLDTDDSTRGKPNLPRG